METWFNIASEEKYEGSYVQTQGYLNVKRRLLEVEGFESLLNAGSRCGKSSLSTLLSTRRRGGMLGMAQPGFEVALTHCFIFQPPVS